MGGEGIADVVRQRTGKRGDAHKLAVLLLGFGGWTKDAIFWQRAALLIASFILKGYVDQPLVCSELGIPNTTVPWTWWECSLAKSRVSKFRESWGQQLLSFSFKWLLADDGSKVVKPKQQLCQLFSFYFPVFLCDDRYTPPSDMFCLFLYTFYTVIPAFNILVFRQAASLSVSTDSCRIYWEHSSFPGCSLILKKFVSWGASHSSSFTCDR